MFRNRPWNNNDGTNGGGGGISLTYTIPNWQKGFNSTANQGSGTKRNIPDIAMVAQNVRVFYNNGSVGTFWGTSISAPLWAGYTSLINQRAAADGRPSMGFLNPALYALGRTSSYSSLFHDVTTGNNTNRSSTTLYSAVAGFDLLHRTGYSHSGPDPRPGEFRRSGLGRFQRRRPRLGDFRRSLQHACPGDRQCRLARDGGHQRPKFNPVYNDDHETAHAECLPAEESSSANETRKNPYENKDSPNNDGRLVITGRLAAQSYSIDWFSIDSGSGTSTGGPFSMSGTIGQPDAGPTMTSGNYSLTGGFWALCVLPGRGIAPIEDLGDEHQYDPHLLAFAFCGVCPATECGLEPRELDHRATTDDRRRDEQIHPFLSPNGQSVLSAGEMMGLGTTSPNDLLFYPTATASQKLFLKKFPFVTDVTRFVDL